MKTKKRRALPQLINLYLRISREDLIKAGIDAKGRKLDRAAAERLVIDTAHHEAAHAVMERVAKGNFPVLVSIERGSDQLGPGWGFTRCEPSVVQLLTPEQIDGLQRTQELDTVLYFGAERDAMVCLAGPVADAMADLGDVGDVDLDHDDCRKALAVVSKVERDRGGHAFRFNAALTLARDVLGEADVWEVVQGVAEALLNTPTLNGAALAELLAEAPSFDELVYRWGAGSSLLSG